MPVLPSDLRSRLEKTVVQARRTAEAAAKVALERLHVGHQEQGAHLTPDERALRNRLRAHGRQLGDRRDPKGTQSIDRLIHECAYEHWHRMLFARFLAENNLLIHEREQTPVTLAECDELARDEGAPDGWTLASRYAARMLPQIFRPDDPVLQVAFAPEHKRTLEKMVMDLLVDVFTADDSLGWVYQFWQAERKNEVNASGDKITGETLPAVTQLFTEHYMVLFLLHNTIGAWRAARLKSEGRISKSEWDKCQTEDDCRKLVALPGYEFTYLRFIKDGNGEWVPAAGGFPGWPKALKDFKLLDPCCGSGHFLVAAFVVLVLLRMRDERLSAKEACDAVLRENLHGLELDPRCTQIAAFALAMTAWKFTEGFRPLPPINIACSGLGVNARKEDWLALANGDKSLLYGMEQLYDLFQKAPELGSLINPRSIAQPNRGYVQESDLYFKFAEIQPLLAKALHSEKAKRNDDLNEIGVAAQGMAQAVSLLSAQYHLVTTNVPYLGRGKQDEILQDFCEISAPTAKADLATVFVQRCLDFTSDNGRSALVTPQNWSFIKTYADFRKSVIEKRSINIVAHLGTSAFETISGEVVSVSLMVFSRTLPPSGHLSCFLDVTVADSPSLKAMGLAQSKCAFSKQDSLLGNPDYRMVILEAATSKRLKDVAYVLQGLSTGDNPQFQRKFWEASELLSGWSYLEGSTERPCDFGGKEHVVWMRRLETDGEGYGAALRGNRFWGRKGISTNRLGDEFATLYLGSPFDINVNVIIPRDPSNIGGIYEFCRSPEFNELVRKIDRKAAVTNATVGEIPFDESKWLTASSRSVSLPTPFSNDPTQSLFAGHPVDSAAPLQVGMARLLGYAWPRQTGQTVSGAPPVPEDGLERFVDEDGIVCIPSVRGEGPAAERLRELLARAYGKEWSPAKLDELLTALDYAGASLEEWLRNGFFDQHCKLFHQRPFIWQIWDGRRDGFSALVNYHLLDHKLLEKLTYTYLNDWIRTQQKAVDEGKGGADDRLLKAQQFQKKLELILEGEKPHDIFVRWKPLEQQPIGWHPDLNDGVRLNIRPFMEADILRKRPNIKWGIDRGKNPSGSPWGEERDNDQHLSLEEKRKARGH